MVVQHNIMALNAYNRLSSNNSLVSKNLEKLSSGYKINRAGDDAAGLAISEKMRAQITGLERASDNAQDGISLVQTAEGALTEVHSMLNRMTELATQSSNGTFDNAVDRTNLQKEVTALKDEIDRIASSTNFNGIKLLDGSLGSGTTGAEVAGSTAGEITSAGYTVEGAAGITVAFAATDGTGTADGTKTTTAAWGANNTLTITLNGKNTSWAQADIDSAISSATGAPPIADGLKVTLNDDITVTATGSGTAFTATGTTAAAKQAVISNSGVTVTADKAGTALNGKALSFATADADHSANTAAVSADGSTTVYLSDKSYSASEINGILSGAGAGMTVSFDDSIADDDLIANTGLTLANGTGLSAGGGLGLQIGDTAEQRITVKVGDMSSKALGLGAVDISTETNATNSIAFIKTAINTVSSTRADLGAIQNRLEYTVNNLATTTENLTSAESRIRDTDMADEMMAYTKNNVLSQAAQAMLAQANQQPQQVLQLLQ